MGVGLDPSCSEVSSTSILDSMVQKTSGSNSLGIIEIFTEVKYDELLACACLFIKAQCPLSYFILLPSFSFALQLFLFHSERARGVKPFQMTSKLANLGAEKAKRGAVSQGGESVREFMVEDVCKKCFSFVLLLLS